MKYVYTARVEVSFRDVGGDFGGFLDMLRYDGCTVHSWGHIADATLGQRYFINLRSDRPFTTPRWASFGLHLTELDSERVR